MPSSGRHSRQRLCNWLQRSRRRWLQFCQSVRKELDFHSAGYAVWIWSDDCHTILYCTTICRTEEAVARRCIDDCKCWPEARDFWPLGNTAEAASSHDFLQWAADLRIRGELTGWSSTSIISVTTADEYWRLVLLRNLGYSFVFMTRITRGCRNSSDTKLGEKPHQKNQNVF